jgi:Fic family protein
MYIHEREDWPRFYWDTEVLTSQLAAVRHRQGRLIGRMEGLGFRLREEAAFRTLTQDVLKTSEIEGEILDLDQVRSSLARRLGLDIGSLTPPDCHVDEMKREFPHFIQFKSNWFVGRWKPLERLRLDMLQALYNVFSKHFRHL